MMVCMRVYRLLLLTQAIACVICSDQTAMPLFVKDLTDSEFDIFTNSSSVRVVYFYKKDLPRLEHFFTQYEKSAELVKVHHVQFGKVDCTKNNVKKYCEKEDSEKFIFTFKSGRELLQLSLDSMFDVDAILSNVLQIVLLQEVPIVQTPEEYGYFERRSSGKKDIVLNYHRAIGTYAHRILMEVAFVYQTNYQFLLTTEKDVIKHLQYFNDNEDAAIWLMRCKDNDKDDPCEAVKYKDTMNLACLARFLRVLDLPPKSFVPRERDLNFYHMNGMNTVICLYDDNVYEEAMAIVDDVVRLFRGVVGVAVVHIDELESINGGFKLADKFAPVIGIKLRDATSFDMALPGSDMEDFIGSRLEKLISKETVVKEHSSFDMEEADEDRDDDEIARVVTKLRSETINKEHVRFLTDNTFSAAVNNAQLLIVLFYLVFDARSMLFLHSYVDASHILADSSPLAAVNCYDWPHTCQMNSITIYPTVLIFRRNQKPVQYNGILGMQAIVSTAQLYLADAPVMLTSEDEAHMFLEGNHPSDIHSATTVSVLGIFTDSDSPEYLAFSEAAKQLHGHVLLGSIIKEAAMNIASELGVTVPSIVVCRHNDRFQPQISTTAQTTSDDVIKYINHAKFPVFPELRADNYAVYFARQQPFVILFERTINTDAFKILGTIAAQGKLTGITFCWMNLAEQGSIGQAVMQTYHMKTTKTIDMFTDPATKPALTFVDHLVGHFYNYDKSTFTAQSVSNWIVAVLKGHIEPSGELVDKQWQPLKEPIDFVQKMDENVGTSDDKDVVTEEQGIGFDADENYMDSMPPSMGTESTHDDETRKELNKRMRYTRVHSRQHTEL